MDASGALSPAIGASPGAPAESSPGDLLRQLRLHQVELETQNESLRQAQTALEESRDRYVDLFEFAPVGYLTLGPNGLISEANRAAGLILSCEASKLCSRRFDLLLQAEDRAIWRRICRQATTSSRAQRIQARLARADAAPFHVQLECQPAAGRPGWLRVTLSDIRELKQAEERYRLLFESSIDAIFLTRPEGEILAANPAAQRMFGYSEEEFRSLGRQGLADLSDPRLAPALAQRQQHGQFSGELTFLRRGGVKVPVEISSSLYLGADGRLSSCIIVRDISERKQAESRLHALRSELGRVLEWQVARHTAAALAHEVNQPLSSLCALSETALRLLAAAPASEALPLVLQRIATESERAGRVVRNLLDSLHRPLGATEPVALAALLADAAQEAGADVLVLVECPADLPQVLAHRQQVEKVLHNLLCNAREALACSGRSGGRIWLQAARTAAAEVTVTVRDDGPGLDQELARRIFHPFATARPDGLGMGLVISRSLVEAQGGKLWLEESGGPGATFRFTLPCIGALP